MRRELPKQWEPFVSPRKNDAVVFLSRFMGGASTVEAYRRLSRMVQEKIKLQDYLKQWELDSYRECDLFSLFDEAIIQDILGNLLAGVGQFNNYIEIILERRNKHWFKVYETNITPPTGRVFCWTSGKPKGLDQGVPPTTLSNMPKTTAD